MYIFGKNVHETSAESALILLGYSENKLFFYNGINVHEYNTNTGIPRNVLVVDEHTHMFFYNDVNTAYVSDGNLTLKYRENEEHTKIVEVDQFDMVHMYKNVAVVITNHHTHVELVLIDIYPGREEITTYIFDNPYQWIHCLENRIMLTSNNESKLYTLTGNMTCMVEVKTYNGPAQLVNTTHVMHVDASNHLVIDDLDTNAISQCDWTLTNISNNNPINFLMTHQIYVRARYVAIYGDGVVNLFQAA